jgi:hypothetical protein
MTLHFEFGGYGSPTARPGGATAPGDGVTAEASAATAADRVAFDLFSIDGFVHKLSCRNATARGNPGRNERKRR